MDYEQGWDVTVRFRRLEEPQSERVFARVRPGMSGRDKLRRQARFGRGSAKGTACGGMHRRGRSPLAVSAA